MEEAEVLNDLFLSQSSLKSDPATHYKKARAGLFTRAYSDRKGDGFKLRVGLVD